MPEPPDDTWPLFFHEAARVAPRDVPERADEYGDNVRAKLEHAQTIEPDEVERAREAVARVAHATRPPVDLYVAPVLGVELPPEDCDELEVRLPLTGVPAPVQRARLGRRSRSATCSSSRRATRSSSPPASPGRASLKSGASSGAWLARSACLAPLSSRRDVLDRPSRRRRRVDLDPELREAPVERDRGRRRRVW